MSWTSGEGQVAPAVNVVVDGLLDGGVLETNEWMSAYCTLFLSKQNAESLIYRITHSLAFEFRQAGLAEFDGTVGGLRVGQAGKLLFTMSNFAFGGALLSLLGCTLAVLRLARAREAADFFRAFRFDCRCAVTFKDGFDLRRTGGRARCCFSNVFCNCSIWFFKVIFAM